MTNENEIQLLKNQLARADRKQNSSFISSFLMSMVLVWCIGSCHDYKQELKKLQEEQAVTKRNYERTIGYQIDVSTNLPFRTATNSLDCLVLKRNNGQSLTLLEKDGKYFTLEQLKQLEQKKLEDDYNQQREELDKRYKNIGAVQ